MTTISSEDHHNDQKAGAFMLLFMGTVLNGFQGWP